MVRGTAAAPCTAVGLLATGAYVTDHRLGTSTGYAGEAMAAIVNSSGAAAGWLQGLQPIQT